MPEHLRKDMTFIPVDRVEQVWRAAMGLRVGTSTRQKEPEKAAKAQRRKVATLPQAAVPTAAPREAGPIG